MVALLLIPSAGLAHAEPAPPHEIQGFLEGLVGDWRGQATRTPRGPLPYDIRFTRTPGQAVAGVADPGAALHHWVFSRSEEGLRLRFLTTFRGNTAPIWLSAGRAVAGTYQFRAEHPPHLRVRVTPHTDRVHIQVLLHGEAHVEIRLVRQ